ncbi:hypothetical protein GCM10010276_25410 [Streptomyces longisporus]|uniref:Uncharacterized protein n=1 Tax=Streptomyces longisporus TaxID=1948 RepID=A0ABP5YSB0_STRLO
MLLSHPAGFGMCRAAIRRVKRAPPRGLWPQAGVPPWARAIQEAMDRPRPVEPLPLW